MLDANSLGQHRINLAGDSTYLAGPAEPVLQTFQMNAYVARQDEGPLARNGVYDFASVCCHVKLRCSVSSCLHAAGCIHSCSLYA